MEHTYFTHQQKHQQSLHIHRSAHTITHIHTHTTHTPFCICNFGCGPLIFIFTCRPSFSCNTRRLVHKNITHTHMQVYADGRRHTIGISGIWLSRRLNVVCTWQVCWLWLRLRCGCHVMRRWKAPKVAAQEFRPTLRARDFHQSTTTMLRLHFPPHSRHALG